MATHSSILAWEILRIEELGGLQVRGVTESDTTEQLFFFNDCLGTYFREFSVITHDEMFIDPWELSQWTPITVKFLSRPERE